MAYSAIVDGVVDRYNSATVTPPKTGPTSVSEQIKWVYDVALQRISRTIPYRLKASRRPKHLVFDLNYEEKNERHGKLWADLSLGLGEALVISNAVYAEVSESYEHLYCIQATRCW